MPTEEPIVEPVVETPTEPVTPVTPEVPAEPTPEPKPEVMIPKDRFDEVNKKQKELSKQVKEMEEAKAAMAAQLEEMKKSSEETQASILETTKKLEGQVNQYETVMTELVTTKLSAIPEDMRDLIPDGLSTEQKLAWINKAESKGLFKKQQTTVAVGTPLNHSSEVDKAERVRKMNPLQALAAYYSEKK